MTIPEMTTTGNILRLEATHKGKQHVVEAAMPDMRGFNGKMSTYSILFGTVEKMLWDLAATMNDQHENITREMH